VVSLPTSAGKTRIAEIAILDCLTNNPDSKVLYLAPFKSLAFEVEDSLSKVFEPLGFEVSQLYGGTQFSKLDEMLINESNVIISTAEKAKAILRSNSEIKSEIQLIIIDEGHLLGPKERYILSEMLIEELRFY
ncbi:DEAD/DEAH box helicase, partial [Escherichia coli]|uniref:DEAD/DEAH box helicase n=1 Tax=Escherichia coli TaxID=562 RepID=UPI00106E4293